MDCYTSNIFTRDVSACQIDETWYCISAESWLFNLYPADKLKTFQFEKNPQSPKVFSSIYLVVYWLFIFKFVAFIHEWKEFPGIFRIFSKYEHRVELITFCHRKNGEKYSDYVSKKHKFEAVFNYYVQLIHNE